MKGGRCNWPRGKVLGGSSVLNYMLYVRGNRHDYDHWEELGNPGWGYDTVLPYFKKSEDNRNPYLTRTPYHKAGGYLTVQESPWHTPLAVAFVDAAQQQGYPVRDINGHKQTGFMIAQVLAKFSQQNIPYVTYFFPNTSSYIRVTHTTHSRENTSSNITFFIVVIINNTYDYYHYN